MAFPLALVLPALLPPIADGLGSIFKSLFGGKGEPQTTDDRVKLMDAETRQLEARGKFLGAEQFGDISQWASAVKPGPVLSWVVALTVLIPRALRESTRPALAWAAIGGAFYLALVGNSLAPAALDISASVYSLYFGDRMWSYIKGRIGGAVRR